MKINRKDLIGILKVSAIGSTRQEVLEQSNSFVFTGGELITFNDEIMARCPSPLGDLEAAIPQSDLLKILSKFPDEDLTIAHKDNELRVKGQRRSAGLSTIAEVLLPISEVEKPDKWKTLPGGVVNMLHQAARTCGRDSSNPLTMVVHVTPKRIEACDNWRLFRVDGKTGFPAECLIPATSIHALRGEALHKVSVGEGWVHFKTTSHVLSCRCSHTDYSNLDPILKLADAEDVTLPANLVEIAKRAEVMTEEGTSPHIKIRIEDKQLTISSRKDNGWYREKKRVKYDGPALAFQVNPLFLVDVMEKTRKVRINKEKLKLETDGIQFVVCLEA